jgi:hypothetical protein
MASRNDARISITPHESKELVLVASLGFWPLGRVITVAVLIEIINFNKYQLFIDFPVTFLSILKVLSA